MVNKNKSLSLFFYFSVAGHCSSPYFAFKMYNASKRAVTTLCDGLRHELQLIGSKIKVSVMYYKLFLGKYITIIMLYFLVFNYR